MSKNEYMLVVIETLLDNLNGDGREGFPVSQGEKEEKLCDCAYDFLASLANITINEHFTSKKDPCIMYAYAKIYAFYNSVKYYYCDAYIWEKEANSYFTKITVGCYNLVRDFMSFLEDYRDGRI